MAGVALSSLTVQATFDATAYTQGADQKTAADAKMVASGNALSDSLTATDRQLTNAGGGWQSLLNKIDPVAKALPPVQNGLRLIQQQVDNGNLSLAQAATTVDQLLMRYTKTPDVAKDVISSIGGISSLAKLGVTDISNLASAHDGLNVSMGEIIHSGRSVFDMLSSGATPTRALGTEALRTAQAFGVLQDILSPVGIGIAALAGASALVFSAANENAANIRAFNVELTGMGVDSTITATGLEKMVQQIRDAGSSAADAKAQISGVIAAGLNPAAAGAIVTAGMNLGAVTGGNGVSELTTALAGGITTATDLALKIHALSAEEAANVLEMAAHGQAGEALDAVFVKLFDHLAGKYSDSLSDAAKATRDLRAAWDDTLDSIGETGPVQKAIEGLTNLLQGYSAVLKGTGSLMDWFSALGPVALIARLAGPNVQSLLGITPTPQAAATVSPGTTPSNGNLSALVASIIQTESAGNPNAVSPAGAQGLMQLMPGTAAGLGVTNPFDPGQNVAAGTKYIQQLITKYGDVQTALEAYNWGEGNVDQYLAGFKDLPQSVANYATTVMSGAGIAPGTTGAQLIGVAGGVSVNNPAGSAAQLKSIADTTVALDAQNEQLQQSASLWTKSGSELTASTAAMDAFNKTIKDGGTDEQAMQAAILARTKVLDDANATQARTVSLGELEITNSNNIAAGYSQSAEAGVKAEAMAQATLLVYQKTGDVQNNRNLIEQTYQQILVQTETTERDNNAKAMLGYADTQEALTLQISLQGQSADEIARQLTILQAKQTIDRDFPLLSQQEKDARLATATAIADQVQQLNLVEAEWGRINSAAVGVGQTLETDIVNNMTAAFDNQKVTSWGTILHQVLAQAEAQILDIALLKPAIGSVLQTLGLPSAGASFGSFGRMVA